MVSSRGGESSPPPSTTDSFCKLLATQGKKLPPVAPPSFVKKLESILEIVLPPDHPMSVAVSLSDHGLVGQFMGLWSFIHIYRQLDPKKLVLADPEQCNLLCGGKRFLYLRIHLTRRSRSHLQKQTIFHGNSRALLEPLDTML
jgi:hypothetical protein